MKKVIFPIFALLFVVSLAFVGCRKKQEPLFDQSSVDNAQADAQFNDLDNIVSDVMLENNNNLRTTDEGISERTLRFRNCGIVTINAVTKTIVIDFGTGTTCNDGRTRRGKIIINYTGGYMTPGSVITTTTQDYYVNDVKVEGVKVVTNVTQPDQVPTHTVSVRNGKLTFPDGTTFTWQTDRVRVWQQGYGDLNPYNEVIQITGTASGTNRRGVNFTAEITVPIVVKTECWLQGIRKPVSGVYVVTSENAQKTVDFGNGTCDRIVTVTITGPRGGTFTFPLN
ncbi:hypothetical protein [Raineya orbicola]|uniref:Lipoprotein n=1 Tax=Raineya orbicola TaxID=2016530 RepID=A0A2N3IJG9_9BACT|nr:hypothetical protein [Raineya orbicola]PKQ70482.1 hypothetical protein Rain11_0402 [Raineya orbicola]